MNIVKIKLRRLSIPLISPYKLAYKTLKYFDSFIIEVVNNKNKSGIFEVTALPGYFKWTGNYFWKDLKAAALNILKSKQLNEDIIPLPFIFAINNIDFTYEKFNQIEIPLIHLIKGISYEDLKRELELAKKNNFISYKVKIGFLDSIEKDIDRLEKIMDIINPEFEIRVDANGSLGLQDAIKIAKPFSKNLVYLEQPFPNNDFDKIKKLKNATDIKIMLDETVNTYRDINEIIKQGCIDYVKLKLARFKSFFETVKVMNKLEDNNIKVVIGNGVSTDINNYFECLLWQQGRTKVAGEMNGFLKYNNELLKNSLKIKNGYIVKKNSEFKMNLDNLEKFISDYFEV